MNARGGRSPWPNWPRSSACRCARRVACGPSRDPSMKRAASPAVNRGRLRAFRVPPGIGARHANAVPGSARGKTPTSASERNECDCERPYHRGHHHDHHMLMPVIIIMTMTIIMALTTASAVPGCMVTAHCGAFAIAAARQEKLAPGVWARLVALCVAIGVGADQGAAQEAGAPAGPRPAVSEQQFVDDLRRELERASKAVPRSVWKASDACRDVARAGTKKACADVRDLRDAVEMAEQTAAEAAKPAVAPANAGKQAVVDQAEPARVNWWLILILFLGSSLPVLAFVLLAYEGSRQQQAAPATPSPQEAPTRSNPIPPQSADAHPAQPPPRSDTAREDANSARRQTNAQERASQRDDPPSWNYYRPTLAEAVERWMAERLAWDAASEITARGAFEDFRELVRPQPTDTTLRDGVRARVHDPNRASRRPQGEKARTRLLRRMLLPRVRDRQ